MTGRKYTGASGYRYGFNGKELDKETSSTTTYDYGFRIYSPAIGKFLSVDPLTKQYPWYTPYQFAGNIPIAKIDLDGLEEVSPTIHYNPNYQSGSASWPALKPSQWKNVDRSSATGTFLRLHDIIQIHSIALFINRLAKFIVIMCGQHEKLIKQRQMLNFFMQQER